MSPAPKEAKAPEEPAAAPQPKEPAGSSEKPGRKERGPKGKETKEPREGKGKGRAGAPPTKTAKAVSDNPDFRYIVRVADTDLDGTRSVGLALTRVRGIGLRLAETACRLAQVNPADLIGNLPEGSVEALETTLRSLPTQVPVWMVNHHTEPVLGDSIHYIGTDVETRRRDDVNVMKMIRSYRGVRHERLNKVRGQRTRSNGRTGMAAGVLKKAAKEAAAGGSTTTTTPSASAK